MVAIAAWCAGDQAGQGALRADVAASPLLILLYETDAAAIPLHILLYEAHCAKGVELYSSKLQVMLLPITRHAAHSLVLYRFSLCIIDIFTIQGGVAGREELCQGKRVESTPSSANAPCTL